MAARSKIREKLKDLSQLLLLIGVGFVVFGLIYPVINGMERLISAIRRAS